MSIGRLIRNIDPDVVARVENGVKYKPKPLKKQGTPRLAHTYRAARANRAINLRRERKEQMKALRLKVEPQLSEAK